MGCRLFGTKPISEPIMTYCQLDPRKIVEWNIIWNSKVFIQENAFENVVWKMAAILSLPRWVNLSSLKAGLQENEARSFSGGLQQLHFYFCGSMSS